MKASDAKGLRQIRTYWPLVLILIAVVIVSFIIIYAKVSSQPLFVYYFEETKGLGNTSANSFSPQIATSGNDTYIVWSSKSPVNEAINLEKISGPTGTLTFPVNISNNNSNSTNPEVAVSGDYVYLVWTDSNGTKASHGNIFFSSSPNKGKTHDKPVNLTNSGNSTNPEIAADGNNVYVVWANSQNGGNGDIFLSSSRDKGKSFHDPVNLSNNKGNSTNPEIAADGNNVYVVWAESTSKTDKSNAINLILKASTDNGAHFTKKTIKKDIDKNTHLPQIVASAGNLYVVVADKNAKEGQPDNYSVILKTSTDNGTSFTNRKGIDKDINKNTHLPQIAASGDNVYVVGVDRNGTKGENGNIFFISSRDKGKSFDEPINLNNSGNSTDPKVSASGNNTYVMWSDSSSENKEIKYKHIKLVKLGS